MPASPAEQTDLATAKADCARERESAFFLCRQVLRAKEPELHSMGYKTKEQAVLDIINRSMKQIDSIWAAFHKKWPDR